MADEREQQIRERLAAVLTVKDFAREFGPGDLADLLDALAAAREENGRLREALEGTFRYEADGHHDFDCCLIRDQQAGIGPGDDSCTCGYDKWYAEVCELCPEDSDERAALAREDGGGR